MMKVAVVVALLALGVSCVSAKCGDPNWACCKPPKKACFGNLVCVGRSANSPGGCFKPTAGCGKEGQACCANRAVSKACNGSLVCNGGKCAKPVPVNPVPVPVPVTPTPVPVPVTPTPVPVPVTPTPVPVPVIPVPVIPVIPTVPVPGPGPAPGGILSTAAIDGSAVAQTASGTSGTQGSGSTLSTKLNGGSAAVQGSQNAFVNGAGPGAAQTNLNGAATLLTGNGGISDFKGATNSAFAVDGVGASGRTDSTVKGFVNSGVAVGEASSATSAQGGNGAASLNSFSVNTLDP